MKNSTINIVIVKLIFALMLVWFVSTKQSFGQICKTTIFNESISYKALQEGICDTNLLFANYNHNPLKIKYNHRFSFIISIDTTIEAFVTDTSEMHYVAHHNYFYIYDTLNTLYFEFNSSYRNVEFNTSATSLIDLVVTNNNYIEFRILDKQNTAVGNVLIQFGKGSDNKSTKVFFKKEEVSLIEELPSDLIPFTNPILICYNPSLLIDCIENIITWINQNN